MSNTHDETSTEMPRERPIPDKNKGENAPSQPEESALALDAVAPSLLPRPPIKCPRCFKQIGLGKKFCPGCGRSREDLARYELDQRELARNSCEANHTWLGLKQMVSLYTLLLLFDFIAAYLLPTDKPWGLLSLDLVIVGLCVRWMCLTPLPVATRFKLGHISPFVLLLIPLTSVITVGVAASNNHLAFWLLGLQDFFQNMQGIERLSETQMPLWVMIVSICVVPGIFEEIFFRGMVMGVLETALSTRETWIVQAIIFAIAHLNPLGFFTYLFIMGLWLGWLRNRTGSLIPGMIAHFTHNLIATLDHRYHWLPW